LKNKIVFNLIFALFAFPIGWALFTEFDFQAFPFIKNALLFFI